MLGFILSHAASADNAEISFRAIPLSRGYVAIVSAEDYEHLSRFRWYPVTSSISNTVYAITKVKKGTEWKTISMHRMLIAAPSNLVVDHVNGHGLDNRRKNLEVVTESENQRRRYALNHKVLPTFVSEVQKSRRLRAYARFFASLTVHSQAGCWEWQGMLRGGYGRFSLRKKLYSAHRISYEWFVGPIPTGLVLDHLCRNRRCVAPFHLEAVTQQENTLRGEGIAAQGARRMFCKCGALLIATATQRLCLLCRRISVNKCCKKAREERGDEIRAKERVRRSQQKDKRNAQYKEYYCRNAERMKARSAAYREADPERARRQAQECRERNREKINARQRERRAQKKAQSSTGAPVSNSLNPPQ